MRQRMIVCPVIQNDGEFLLCKMGSLITNRAAGRRRGSGFQTVRQALPAERLQ
jgi:hypothetical protein